MLLSTIAICSVFAHVSDRCSVCVCFGQQTSQQLLCRNRNHHSTSLFMLYHLIYRYIHHVHVITHQETRNYSTAGVHSIGGITKVKSNAKISVYRRCSGPHPNRTLRQQGLDDQQGVGWVGLRGGGGQIIQSSQEPLCQQAELEIDWLVILKTSVLQHFARVA